jgi:hypothetical protein
MFPDDVFMREIETSSGSSLEWAFLPDSEIFPEHVGITKNYYKNAA